MKNDDTDAETKLIKNISHVASIVDFFNISNGAFVRIMDTATRVTHLIQSYSSEIVLN